MKAHIRTVGVLWMFLGVASAVDNGLARTPQMGWNNWNSLGCDVSEALLLDTSRKLVNLGLRDLGYNYVVLDDCWSAGRGEDGKLIVDSEKFPNGMNYISDKIHEMGMLYGMYSSAGEFTCAHYAGSLDHEEADAESFASWGVDYLKYDNCYSMGRHGSPKISYDRFDAMAKALKKTGRPILYSLCNWGDDYVHTWGMSIANSWRMSGDIYDDFTRPDILCSCDDPRNPLCIAPGAHCSVMSIINRVAAYSNKAIPGGWNDMDMLEVGQGGMSDDEYKAHFTMWAILKSPLLIGADIRDLDPKALSILNNPAVIAVSQDPAGRSAARISLDYEVKKDRHGVGETQVWSGELANGDQVVVFLNAADEALTMKSSLEEIFVHEGPGGSAPQVQLTWHVYDLWAGRMPDEVASEVIALAKEGSAIKAEGVLRAAGWYNATKMPYKQGLEKEDERLFGVEIGKVDAKSGLKAKVPRHGVAAFRLRHRGIGGRRYRTAKDEL